MRKHTHFTVLLAVIDLLVVSMSLLTAAWLSYSLTHFYVARLADFRSLIPWLWGCTVVTFRAMDMYSTWIRKSKSELLATLAIAVSVQVGAVLLLITVGLVHIPRSVVILSMPFQVVMLTLYRLLAQRLLRSHLGRRRLLIVGEDDLSCKLLAEKFRKHSSDWIQVTSALTSEDTSHFDSALAACDTVALTSRVSASTDLMQRSARAGRDVLVVPELVELMIFRAEPESFDDFMFFSVRPMNLSPCQTVLKRALDLIGAGLMLVAVSPILLLVYGLVPLLSKGPAIFAQERLGRLRQPFRMYKFRTMVVDAEKHTGPVLSTEGDPRITRLGAFLRATRIDELPQLFNVLKGDMSLVGPRPERQCFVEEFEKDIPHYRLRMAVKPGITGLAQIMGRYTTSVEDKLRFDLTYVKQYSVLLDLKILLQTIFVVFQPERANGTSRPHVDLIRQPQNDQA